jgi:hypothetical protein
LRPPPFNLRKELLLFEERSATKNNNNVLQLWLFCKRQLPWFIHGAPRHPEQPEQQQRSSHNSENQVTAYNTQVEEDPVALLYNMAFVQIPAVVARIVYIYNLSQGRPLIVDLGDGAFEINPLVVGGALFVFLR